MNPPRSIAAWLLALSLVVCLLIVWGGIVRLSGSGLSIPEWPIINGSLLPPFSDEGWNTVYHTYYSEIHGINNPTEGSGMELGQFKIMFAIEYIHRLLAALVGIIFLAVFVRAKRSPYVWLRIKKSLIAAAVLLVAQAVLGGIVVKTDLKADMVAAHLGIAFIFFALLLWTSMRVARIEEPAAKPPAKIKRLSWLAVGTVWLQIVTGGMVAGTGAGLFLNTWPKMGDHWIPPLDILFADKMILIQFIHRWLAFVALVHVILFIARAIKLPLEPRARIALRAVSTVIVLQVLLGIGNLLMKVPFWMSLTHLTVGLILFALLIILSFEVNHPRAQKTS